MKLTICLYSPYIPKHLGGGERYMFDVALSLAKTHQVSIAISSRALSTQDQNDIRIKYQKFLGESLDHISFVPSPLGTSASFFKKLDWTKKWDVLYHLTDGSLLFSAAKKNILHIQFPFTFHKNGLLDRVKFTQYQVKNTNSKFTKKIIEDHWPISVDLVHHPKIEQGLTLQSAKEQAQTISNKENVILHVGRFFRQMHSKRQDILVTMFEKLIQAYKLKDWKLVLIGSVEDPEYAKQVAQQAKKLPIEIHHNVSRQELLNWYSKASIYWHATGFNIDQSLYPEKVEHFGITTGEAMSFGCAPVVINKGGQPELLGAKLKHLLWNSEEDCLKITQELIDNTTKRTDAQQAAIAQIKQFSPEIFDQKLATMVS